MRIRDWRFPLVFLFLCMVIEGCFAGSTKSTVLNPQKDPAIEREFQHAYQTMSNAPSIFIGSGAPNFVPQKTGDIYVDTTTPHFYASTATVTSGSWLLVK